MGSAQSGIRTKSENAALPQERVFGNAHHECRSVTPSLTVATSKEYTQTPAPLGTADKTEFMVV